MPSPKTPAMLLIIDMQKQFTHPDGRDYYPEVRRIVPPLSRLVERVRARAREMGTRPPVIWTYDVHDREPDFEFNKLPEHGRPGSTDTEPDETLQPADDEVVVKKRRFSAFFGTDLDMVLRERGVETVVLAGNKTNVCVRATATDALAHGYAVRVVRDATASNRSHLHEANLEDIDRYIGSVIDGDEAEALLCGRLPGSDS